MQHGASMGCILIERHASKCVADWVTNVSPRLWSRWDSCFSGHQTFLHAARTTCDLPTCNMRPFVLLRLLCLVSTASSFNFTNEPGPNSRTKNGGHSPDYQPILEVSEVLLATTMGKTSTALDPFGGITSNATSPSNVTSVQLSRVFRRQDDRPPGALKCSATEKCVDGSCCGAVSSYPLPKAVHT